VNVSDDEAAWFGMATIVQTGVRRAAHELGENVVVIGAGLLGQLVTQYVRLLGAREIIMIDTAAIRLSMALKHGATQSLQMPAAEAYQKVAELTRGRMADVVYDVTGHSAVFPVALQMVRNFGKMILLGDAGNPTEQRLTADVITRGLQIIGAHDRHAPAAPSDFAHWTKANMAALFFHYLEHRQMSVASMITHRYSPADARSAYQMLLTDRATAMGVVFDWKNL
jgi:threonine dehydrogenase-like Zn-dependent dehydrogenase